MSNIIWIDQNIKNEENLDYVRELKELGYKNIKLYEKIGRLLII